MATYYLKIPLSEELDIPVWHDDRQGTVLVVLAGLLDVLKIVGKKPSDVRITFVGLGPRTPITSSILLRLGEMRLKMILVDIDGILHMNRKDIGVIKEKNPWLYEAVKITNPEGSTGEIPEAMRDADVIIAASAPGPSIIRKEWIRKMRDNPIVFALANPVPEIWPSEAKEAGARIVAAARSDFPNQINDSLGFPAVFRGILTVWGRKLTDEIFIAAAKAIAGYAEKQGLNENHIVPTMDDTEMYIEEALAVAEKAIEIGVARRKPGRSGLEEEIRTLIYRPKKYMAIALGYNYVP
jgi:malate dehydrogenase (oxaloacetate-decarboxylating)